MHLAPSADHLWSGENGRLVKENYISDVQILMADADIKREIENINKLKILLLEELAEEE